MNVAPPLLVYMRPTVPTPPQHYTVIKIKGPLSVIPTTSVKGEVLYVYILMGPTGSGKSAFVESLAPNQGLSISKDSLESVTKQVVCYRVVNLSSMFGERACILMDTPGLLDTKLSEGRITRMITEELNTLRDSAKETVVSILYFQPITDVRIGGSKRHALKLLRAFAESFQANGIHVITTMWNMVSSPRQIEEANHRFASLKDEIYTNSAQLYMNITKFEFTKESALSALDGFYGVWRHDTSQKIDPHYQYLIRNNLLERISNAQMQLQLIADDKRIATRPGRKDSRLLELALRDEEVVLTALQSFLDDLMVASSTGLIELQAFLDARYMENPITSSSPWPPADFSASAASARFSFTSPPDAASSLALSSLSGSTSPKSISSPSMTKPPLSAALCCQVVVAWIKWGLRGRN